MTDDKNILIMPEGKEITLADNKVYKLSPLNLHIFAELEKELNYGINKMGGMQAVELEALLYVLLKDRYPELSRRQVGELVTPSIMTQAGSIIGNIISAGTI